MFGFLFQDFGTVSGFLSKQIEYENGKQVYCLRSSWFYSSYYYGDYRFNKF